MRRAPAIVVAVGAALVAGLAVALNSGRMPLGVPGEWEWTRVRYDPERARVYPAVAGIAAYAIVAALGVRSLAGRVGWVREGAWLAALVLAAVVAQGLVQDGSPVPYGLEKWIFALHNRGANGYYSVAREQMGDTSRFLAEYPTWIARQDALHIGTHPPGLFLSARAAIGLTRGSPALTDAVLGLAPPSTIAAIKLYRKDVRLTRADAAALVLIGALTLLACSATVVPVYLLARASGLSSTAAWASAAMWPLVPSALMFQPTADAAFPLLSTSALALTAWSRGAGRYPGLATALGAGIILGVGMMFTLAFLAVGLIVALVIAVPPGAEWRRRLGLIAATGVGFLGVTLASWAATSANPFAIWWHNQANHARFYVENPRTYWAWVLANPIETAVALGLPATTWAAVGLASARDRSLRVAWATVAVLAFLTLGGRSLSEVGRLWLPFLPALLVAAGAGFARLGGGPKTLGATAALLGVQTLAMEAAIQVVYPV